MTRRRTTWGSNPHTASAPPATPNEGTNHPAYQPEPSADKYMTGDPSSWGEDVHPGPYPNSAPPADPGMQEPQGHPATDPAHYFPGGSKAASRNLQAAMQQKAAKCIRIATAMLGRKASVDAIEDQALDFMNLSDRQIQAMLGRIAEQKGANSTLTPPRSAEDLLADDLMVDEDDVDEGVQAVKMAEDENEDEDADDDKEAAKKAAHFRRQAEHWEKKAAELRSATDEDEDERLLSAMLEEEAKKASKKSEDEEEESDKEASKKSEDEEEESDKEASKKSEDEEEESDKEASDDEDEDDEDKAAGKKAGLGDGGVLADLMDDEYLDEEFGDDPMALMDDSMDESLSADEMMAVYGNKFAGKKSKKAAEEEESKDEPKEDPKEAAKKAARLSPKPRVASTGPKTLGSVSSTRTASAEISDLSKLWASSPDVSKVFGS